MEGQLASGGAALLLDRGLPGLIILALAFVAWRLFNMYTQVQEKRIEEAKAFATALEASTSAQEQLADLVRDRLGRL